MYTYPVMAFGVLLPFGIVAIYFFELFGNRKALAPKVFRPEAISDAELQRIPRQVLGLRENRADDVQQQRIDSDLVSHGGCRRRRMVGERGGRSRCEETAACVA